MPAIDLAKLKTQSVRLSEKFERPVEFLSQLHDLLEFYSDRTIRPGQVSPVSVLPTFRAPLPILRQVDQDLAPLVDEYPERGLRLADALWEDGYVETRLLAAFALGHLPPLTPRLIEHLTAWVAETREPTVRDALLTTGLTRLRREAPSRFLLLIAMWMDPAREAMWSFGVDGLMPLLAEETFENLPPIFELVRPLIENAPTRLQNELTELLNALYRRSPTETVFYLRESLSMSKNRQMGITLRRIARSLPEALQEVVQAHSRRLK